MNTSEPCEVDQPLSGTDREPDASTALRTEVLVEIMTMLRFAWRRGLTVPQDVRDQLGWLDAGGKDVHAPEAAEATLSTLADMHAALSRLVAPAMPITLQLFDGHLTKTGWAAAMGPIGNVRLLLMAALLFMVAFMSISMSSELNVRSMSGDIYTLQSDTQLVVMGFLLSAAGIGATFQALFTAQRFVANATYDPRYDGSYWILIALGLVAGLLLSVLVPVSMEGTGSPTLAKPVLALLGGFSSRLVYRMLQRLVDTIDSLFQPRPSGS